MPVCYQHDLRETGVQCTRCSRFICTECMVNAPVGYQCPHCAAAVRQPKTRAQFGGTQVQEASATKLIIGICVGIFVAQLISGGSLFSIEKYGMFPAAIAEGEYYRLITAAFLHGGFMHIAFNMYALYALGSGLEQMLGRNRYVTLYVLTALAGNVASYWFSPPISVSVGASGAIFGLMAAMIIIGREMRADVSQIVTLFVINVIIGFASSGIDWRAHLGGAAVGALVAKVYTQNRTRGAQTRANVAIILISAVLVGLAVARTVALIG